MRAAAAIVWALIGAYWLGVAARYPDEAFGFRLLLCVLVLTGAICAAAALFPALRGRIRWLDSALRSGAIALGLCALLGAPLLRLWIVTYGIWVIQHGHPCGDMGGGPGGLFVAVTSWIVAGAAATYAFTGGRPSRATLITGVVLGGVLLLGAAAAMFPAPEIFAALLGCRPPGP